MINFWVEICRETQTFVNFVFFLTNEIDFTDQNPKKNFLVCEMHKNVVITMKLWKAIEMIMDPFQPDSKNIDQSIKTAVANLLGWNFEDWLNIVKSPSCESLKLFLLAEQNATKTWKIILVCKIYIMTYQAETLQKR